MTATGRLFSNPSKVLKEKSPLCWSAHRLDSGAMIVSQVLDNDSQRSTRAEKIHYPKEAKPLRCWQNQGKIRGPTYQLRRNPNPIGVLTPTVRTLRFLNLVLD